MKHLPLALLFLATPALAQAPPPITVTLTAQEIADITTALSHEVQLACMLGQCAASSLSTLTIPRKFHEAEQAALEAAQKAKDTADKPKDIPK